MAPTPTPAQFDPVGFQEVFLEETFKSVEVVRRELLPAMGGARELGTTTESLTAESCYNVRSLYRLREGRTLYTQFEILSIIRPRHC